MKQETDINTLQDRVRELEQENTALRSQAALLQDVLSSRSWKLTRPLRAVGELLRTLSHRAPQPLCEASPMWPPDVRALRVPLPLAGSPSSHTSDNDLPPGGIGVFFHIYYPELAEEMLACLRHVPRPSLYISTDSEVKKERVTQLFSAAGYEPTVRVCPNQGWDIAPFLLGFADAIPRHHLLLRLHSKRSPHIVGGQGEGWREMLYGSLAGSPERVRAILSAFAADPVLGMVCPPVLPYYSDALSFGGNFVQMRDVLAPLGVTIQPDTPLDFPMGSMFWCRPAVLRPWLDKQFTYDDFRPLSEDQRDSSLAHALERLFFFGCGLAGHTWARLPA